MKKMNDKKINKLLDEIGHPPADSKWHIITTITIAKKIRSGKRKGQIIVSERSVWTDMKPEVYPKLVKNYLNSFK